MKAFGYSRDALLFSVNHAFDRKRGTWTGGGAFLCDKRLFTSDIGHMPPLYYRNGREAWRGPVVPAEGMVPEIQTIPPALPKAEDVIGAATAAYGATAWKRMRPGNPGAQALPAAFELASQRPGSMPLPLQMLHRLSHFRALPKRLWRDPRAVISTLGSEYLNFRFGWENLLRDIRDMYNTYRRMERALAQLERDNGRGVRRRSELSNSTTTTSSVIYDGTLVGQAFYPGPPRSASGRSRLIKETISTERVWSSARFRYWVPDIGSSEWTGRATRVLFGANPTPASLWEVLPWSWLVDYFSNVGDVLSNFSANAVDNLVADYAFVMKHVSVEQRWTATAHWSALKGHPSWADRPGGSLSIVSRRKTETKLRGAATPFGFNVEFGGLSTHQLGILTALGVSRSSFRQ